MQVNNIKPRVGSEVTIDRDDFLNGKYAGQLQDLLVERSALVFPGMFLTDEEQLQFARTIGEVFLVGGDQELQNISMDPKINPVADYTRGAFLLAHRRSERPDSGQSNYAFRQDATRGGGRWRHIGRQHLCCL